MDGEPSAKRTKVDDDEVHQALQSIEENQKVLEELNKEAAEEMIKIEQIYSKKRQPVFNQRSECIAKVPKFWLKVFNNHHIMRRLMPPDEKECLSYLTNVDVEEFEDIRTGYRFKFTFDENPYFTNRVLIKGFYNDKTRGPTSTATHINWLDGKSLLNNFSNNRKQNYKMTFFKWFSDESNTSANHISEALKEDIWPNPILYYTKRDISSANGILTDSDVGSVIEIDDSNSSDDSDDDNDIQFNYNDSEGEGDSFHPDLSSDEEDGIYDGELNDSSSGVEERVGSGQPESVEDLDSSFNSDEPSAVNASESSENPGSQPSDNVKNSEGT
ncbi:unnamed protein product [Bemisia tabaci]|uniref:Protein SET n=1 Tax=Bemisia tabaci TaxID=7038 RepID=A0A9P0F0Z6_BEMTA|nr:PREDICTED: protein SET-like [Bemisia tabaci]XP_018907776.1 PREDICTED: protein SET-like [Bemisia tabaci]CAH0385132.1 unnamed protein product [Bemisia tabaci]